MAEDTINAGNYTPITQGLRGRLKVTALGLSKRMAEELLAECDNIDAIHKELEDKNERLHMAVAAHAENNVETETFLDRLSDAAKKREDMTIFGVDYTALLLDADKVPIHVGDMMHGTCPSGKYVCGEVSAIGDNKFWLCNVQFSLHPSFMHHYHKPTVADVLREFVTEFNRDDSELCDDEIIERYAKRLQLADGDAE